MNRKIYELYDKYKIEVVSLKPDIDVEKIIFTVEDLIVSHLLKLEYNTISSTNNNLNDIIDYIYGNI